jgi:putative addiction module killer protein
LDVIPRRIYYYETATGRCPFLEWRDALRDQVLVDALRARLARIRLGLLGHAESVGKGVFELKVDVGPGYRVYFAEWKRTIVVLLSGGDKSTQRRDIKLAQAYWADFRRSNP